MKCPECGSPAYVGLREVECSNPRCKHYVERDEPLEFDDDPTPTVPPAWWPADDSWD